MVQDIKAQGRRIPIVYLPTFDAMLEAARMYQDPVEVVGAALYKIEQEHCLFLTDDNDPDLQQVYARHSREADALAAKLWKLNNEGFYSQWTPMTARILAGSFHTVFRKYYGSWRRDLQYRRHLRNLSPKQK